MAYHHIRTAGLWSYNNSTLRLRTLLIDTTMMLSKSRPVTSPTHEFGRIMESSPDPSGEVEPGDLIMIAATQCNSHSQRCRFAPTVRMSPRKSLCVSEFTCLNEFLDSITTVSFSYPNSYSATAFRPFG